MGKGCLDIIIYDIPIRVLLQLLGYMINLKIDNAIV